MSNPYIGEIRMFGGNFPPSGWAFCSGQTMPISQNDALFNLIGTTYGGDGESTFNLPDLQSRVPVHLGTGSTGTTYQIGETGGVEAVTLSTNQIPAHTHTMLGGNLVANDPNPKDHVLAESSAISLYQSAAPIAAMAPQMVSAVGGSQPHENMQPFLVINYIISLFGIYPSPT